MAWSDPKTWSAAEVLTASDLNQYVSDNLSALYALVQGGGRKNLLHNGAMQVAQRGTSTAGLTGASGLYYTADRWNAYISGVGTWTQSVEADAPTGSGFRKSLKWLITAGNEATVGAADYVLCQQILEGQDLQAIKKGTASAEPLTLSFWTKSNKTGVYVVELRDHDNTRSVSATYTVASSGTWEQQSVTFPADATGAFDNDNAASLMLTFYLVTGTDWTSGTLATTWGAVTTANRAVGQTNLAADTNNYWQITGVQLEVGSAATGFEHKSFAAELAECQRYYQQTASGVGAGSPCGAINGHCVSTNYALLGFPLPVTMRTGPTSNTLTNLGLQHGGATKTTGTMTVGYARADHVVLQWLDTGATLTTGQAVYLINNGLVGGATALLALSADL